MATRPCHQPPVGHADVAERPTHSDVGSETYAMDELEAELKRLAAAHEELVDAAPSVEPAGQSDVDALLFENDALRNRVAELEELLQHGGQEEDAWGERQKEYEALLEEKSEVIRSLYVRVQELQEVLEAGPAPAPQSAPISISDVPAPEDLVRLKRELEEQRRQLEEDEESMLAQMRQMELALSRDRAELARQRNELQRLQADLNREIENASRDSGLNDRLKALRSHRDPPATPAKTDTPTAPTDKNSGFFRKMFGG